MIAIDGRCTAQWLRASVTIDLATQPIQAPESADLVAMQFTGFGLPAPWPQNWRWLRQLLLELPPGENEIRAR
jgi:hypothetical protein